MAAPALPSHLPRRASKGTPIEPVMIMLNYGAVLGRGVHR
jgi:hypothetical protein